MAGPQPPVSAAKSTAARVLRLKRNVNSLKYFAAAMAGIMILFMITYWIRLLHTRFASTRSEKKGIYRLFIGLARSARSILIREFPLFPTTGHALIFLAHTATCLSIAFTNLDWSTLNGWAKRMGWVATGNIALSTFLALKNTPLSFLCGHGYERLNYLHQLAGYSTVFWTLFHAVVYIIASAKSRSLHELTLVVNIMGIVAGIAMVIIVLTAIILRKLRYEVFYITHIVMYMLILIGVGMHRPRLATRSLVVVIFSGALWFFDRILRSSKILIYSIGNTATLSPLPCGGTRVLLKRKPAGVVAGSHCFLWIPTIRGLETHPFTVASADPLEFVVSAHDGFTRDLHSYANQFPGKALRASVDGAYGAVPDFILFDKIIFIAGGSGASFTVGLALDLVKKLGESSRVGIEFIWVMKEQEQLAWFSKEIEKLSTFSNVKLSIHYTQYPFVQSTSSPSTSNDIEKCEESQQPSSSSQHLPASPSSISSEHDIEKLPVAGSTHLESRVNVQSGRPDVVALIGDIINSADSGQRIAVAACGPASLMQVVRKTVAYGIKPNGPSLELHVEQFGW